jgi:hypothetical protein
VILPKRLARVDLPEAPRPRMTTRFMALVYCDGRRRVLAGTSPVTRLTRQVELILKELLPSRPSLGNNCQGRRSAASSVLPNSRGKVRSPKGVGRPPR